VWSVYVTTLEMGSVWFFRFGFGSVYRTAVFLKRVRFSVHRTEKNRTDRPFGFFGFLSKSADFVNFSLKNDRFFLKNEIFVDLYGKNSSSIIDRNPRSCSH